VAITAAVAVGLAPGIAGATPESPSDTQIADARAAADAVAARIGALSGELTVAQEAVDAARATAVIALDEYQATRTAYQLAQQEADAAAAVAAQATADLGVARDELVSFARRSYMDGSTYSGAAALITAADPAELIQRAALLEAAGSHRSDVLVRVAVLQEQSVQAEDVARTSVIHAATLQEQAAAELALAQTAELSAREQATALATQRAALESELGTAQVELETLIGERAAADRTAELARLARPVAVPPPPPTTPPAPSGNQAPAHEGDRSAVAVAIEAAMDYRGTPYAWGGGGTRGPGPGMDPDEGIVGFDCSGLTQYAYAEAGISIPRNSRAQYATLPKVAVGDLAPGDLVFWATDPSAPSTIHHVAIYLGGDRILEAPQSGDVVKISPMRWKGYAGAGRPTG
jgi:cell wall-associated NlpC family hydrolase